MSKYIEKAKTLKKTIKKCILLIFLLALMFILIKFNIELQADEEFTYEIDVYQKSDMYQVLEYEEEVISSSNNVMADYRTLEVDVVTQSMDKFYKDNLIYRGHAYKVSYKSEYYDYRELPTFIFVGETTKTDNNINSGDIIEYNNTDYFVIDNHSNCEEFQDDYCVEILSDEIYTDENVQIKIYDK